jgi:hypothetical protein
MTRPAAAPSGTADPRNSHTDRWISRAAAATVAALAGIAGAISYSHMRQLAVDHGQAGWHAHAFPLSVDGIEIVASLVLLADRRAGRKSGWLPWAALAIGTAGSLAANIATAEPGIISRVIAGWPALALLIAVKLLSGMLDHHASSHAASPSPARPARRPDSGTESGPPAKTPGVVRSHPRPHVYHPAQGPASAATASGTVPRADASVVALLPAARAAGEELARDGLALTRDGLAARLRQHGYPVRNARLTPVLRALRAEPPPAEHQAA